MVSLCYPCPVTAFPPPFGLDRRTYGECSGDTMTESDEDRWLTYAEVGELRGVSAAAARMFAKRHGWARRTPNAYGERAQVLVPSDAIVQPRAALNAVRVGHMGEPDQPAPNGHDQVNVQAIDTPHILAAIRETVHTLVTPLREQLEHE